MNKLKLNFKFLMHLSLVSVMGGFFASFDSIINPSSLSILKPSSYIPLNILLFFPGALFSLIYNWTYSRLLTANKVSNSLFAPSFGLWIAAIFGIVLVALVVNHTVSTRAEIVEQYNLGKLNHQDRETLKVDLERFVLNSFYFTLIFFAFITPIVDALYLKKRGIKVTLKMHLELFGSSLAYYSLFFIWRIVLFYAVNIFFFFALWS